MTLELQTIGQRQPIPEDMHVEQDNHLIRCNKDGQILKSYVTIEKIESSQT